MNAVDIVLLIPLLYGAYKGFTRGIILEIATLVALLLGVWGAIQFSSYTEGVLSESIDINESYLPLTAFAVTFVVIVIAIHLLARVLQKIISLAALGLVNKLLGLVFGAVKFALILSFVLVVINSVESKWGSLNDSAWRKESKLYEPISNIGPLLLPVVENNHWYKDYVKDYVDSTEETISL